MLLPSETIKRDT